MPTPRRSTGSTTSEIATRSRARTSWHPRRSAHPCSFRRLIASRAAVLRPQRRGVYISSPSPADAFRLTTETRALAAQNGRDPEDVTFAQGGLSFVIGDTHAEAVRRNDELKRYLDLEGIALHALGDAGIDAGSLPLDTPISQLGGNSPGG